MDREMRSVRFINERVDVFFEKAPVFEKTPDCPSGFVWRGTTYRIVNTLSEWRDYQRRGRMARNMSPSHAAAAEHRGSWGVGTFYFRVQTDQQNQIFDLYYDRAPKGADQRKGVWYVYQELAPDSDVN